MLIDFNIRVFVQIIIISHRFYVLWLMKDKCLDQVFSLVGSLKLQNKAVKSLA